MSQPLHFGWFVGQGFGVQGWRVPEEPARLGYQWQKPAVWQSAISAIEQAGFEFFIIKDASAIQDAGDTGGIAVASGEGGPRHEPILLVPYLLAASSRIGIIPTLNSSLYDPFYAARQIATLYHFDSPRVGLNQVTGIIPDYAQNFALSRDVSTHDEAYEKAAEWIEVVKSLWGSWGSGSLVQDVDGFRYADYSKIERIDHDGKYFRVAGPGVALPFDDEGPLVSAPGTSPLGQNLIGRYGDIQFSYATDPEVLKKIRGGIDRASTAAGRAAGEVKVFPVLSPKVFDSAEDIERYRAYRRTDLGVKRQLSLLSVLYGVDLTRFDYDQPLSSEALTVRSSSVVYDAFVGQYEDGFEIPLRELAARSSHGTPGPYIGSAGEITDQLEELAEASGVNGFVFDFNVDPVSVHSTINQLVPELRRRGLIRESLESDSLRENLRAY